MSIVSHNSDPGTCTCSVATCIRMLTCIVCVVPLNLAVLMVTVVIAVTATAAPAHRPLDTTIAPLHQEGTEGEAPPRQAAAVVSQPPRLDLPVMRSTWANTNWSKPLARETLPKSN